MCFFAAAQPGVCSRTVWAELISGGKASLERGDLVKGRTLLSAACREAEQDKDAELEAQSLLLLAQTYEQEKNWSFAETLLRKAATRIKGLELESNIAEEVSAGLDRMLVKQGTSVAKAKNNTEQIKEKEKQNQPLKNALSAFDSHNYKKAESIFLSILQATTISNVSESWTDLVCIDHLYRIYRDTNQFEKAEKLIKEIIEEIKTRRGAAFTYSEVAAQCFLYLGGLSEIQNRKDEAEILISKGLDMYKLISKARYKRTINDTAKTWELNGKAVEAKAILAHFNAGLPLASQKKEPGFANARLSDENQEKNSDEFQSPPSPDSNHTLKISSHSGWWSHTTKGWFPTVGLRIVNPKDHDLSNTLIKLQAEFCVREDQKIHYVQQKICEKFVPGGGIVVRFQCPVSFDLGFDDTRWPKIKYEVLGKVYTTQDPEIESICKGKIANQILSEDEGLSLLRN